MSGAARLDRWIADGEFEGQHFEIKSELKLGNGKTNAEVLKDLTAMGNGGGGTVVFGLAERPEGAKSRVDGLSLLTDRQLGSRVQDLVNGCVRPTLIWSYEHVDFAEGYVLIADVEPSRLGPYMVENLNENRYWIRIGDRTAPMPERLVHDAYAQAARRAALQEERWSQLGLPLAPTWSHWPHLTVSALPEFDNIFPLDPARVDRDALRADGSDHATTAGIDELTSTLSIWSDGFIASGQAERARHARCPSGSQSHLRIYRGGAIGLGLHIATEDELDPVRALNAQLQYIGMVWTRVGVRAGEIRIKLAGLGPRPTNAIDVPYRLPDLGQGQPFAGVSLSVQARTRDLVSAPERHRVLRSFADQIANMFGRPQATVGFELGVLYQEGVRTELIAYEGRLHWTDVAYSQDPIICTDGAVRRPENPQPFGWWIDGLFVDLAGDAVAALEFCQADGLPVDFVPGDILRISIVEADYRERMNAGPSHPPKPTPTGRWINQAAVDFIRSQPST